MSKKKKNDRPDDFIVPLNMNGLKGRMLRLPAPKGQKRELMFIYGHHSSLERWWGVVQDLNQYGAVTMPDLPGFGGMDSFYRIGKQPTIDNLADYLASFIKLRYKRKKVTVVGLSFGFVVLTRMLQRYPELTKKVEMLVSVVGFTRHDDFKFSKTRHNFYYGLSKLGSKRLPAAIFRNLILHPIVIKTLYHRTSNAKHKFKDISKKEMKAMLDFEVHLWRINDVRTHMSTSAEFLKLDNCQAKIDASVWHVAVENDNYFDNHRVEQHLKVIFPEVHVVKAQLDNHAPSIIASQEEAAPMIPSRLRKILKESQY